MGSALQTNRQEYKSGVSFPRAPPKLTAFVLFFLKDCVQGVSAQSRIALSWKAENSVFSPP